MHKQQLESGLLRNSWAGPKLPALIGFPQRNFNSVNSSSSNYWAHKGHRTHTGSPLQPQVLGKSWDMYFFSLRSPQNCFIWAPSSQLSAHLGERNPYWPQQERMPNTSFSPWPQMATQLIISTSNETTLGAFQRQRHSALRCKWHTSLTSSVFYKIKLMLNLEVRFKEVLW